MPKTREQIIDSARQLGAHCRGTLADLEHWNRTHPNEDPIDPDPDGRLHRIIAAVDELLANDPGVGPIAPLRGVFDGHSSEVH